MDTRDAITNELLTGAAPYGLSKKYPRATVYRIYNELKESGQLPEPGTIIVDEGGSEPQPFIPMAPATPSYTPPALPTASVAVAEGKREVGAETVELGPKTLPLSAVERIRGILGITLRPKVLSCPMPELLYPAMVIACTELGFKPMRPDDFIDTVLYQWLESCDYVPYAYMKRSELEEYAKTYGLDIEGYAKEHGLMTVEEFAKKFNITLPEDGGGEVEKELPSDLEKQEEVSETEPEVEPGTGATAEEEFGELPEPEPAVGELKDEIAEMQREADNEAKETGTEPRKPTVGDLLARLNINNIRKEVKEDGSTGCTEPDNSQGINESGERDSEG